MTRRKSRYAVAVGLLLVIATGAIAMASPGGEEDGDDGVQTLRFGMAFSPFFLLDLGEKGLSKGDEIISRDRLFKPDGRQVGRGGVVCTVTNVAPVESICEAVYSLPGGIVTAQFPNVPGPAPKIGAITGGTGSYRTAHGQLRLVESGRDQDIENNRLVLHIVLRP
jgi:hypothetical protein